MTHYIGHWSYVIIQNYVHIKLSSNQPSLSLSKITSHNQLFLPQWHAFPQGLLICWFTGIYPVTIYINRLRQICNGGLELLEADWAGDYTRIPASFHFDVTWFLVIAERTSELRLQISSHFLFRRGLSFGLSASHGTQSQVFGCGEHA